MITGQHAFKSYPLRSDNTASADMAGYYTYLLEKIFLFVNMAIIIFIISTIIIRDKPTDSFKIINIYMNVRCIYLNSMTMNTAVRNALQVKSKMFKLALAWKVIDTSFICKIKPFWELKSLEI